MSCAYCGSSHSWVDCPARPVGWRPLPRVIEEPEPDFTSGTIQPAEKVKRGRGRPPTGFDRKAYNRDYMRRKRAEAKS